ncbi:MAG: adenylosuccinate synthetase [Archaeoglobaceae archaeon]
MPVTVIVGAQFGGEGKGKITSHLCREHNYDVAVRCGGPNSGHTVTIGGEKVVLRQIPAGVVNPKTKLFLSAGCLIDLDVLLEEIERFDLNSERLKVDRNAAIIDKKFRREEEASGLGSGIGSTCTGTGVAVAKRALRDEDVKLARDAKELEPYLTETSREIMHSHLNGEKVVIEGTQGFGLSLYHSPYYPYTTSRDTTVSGFLSEVGVSPMVVSDIIMVVRTFPIRVGGNSGPLPNEIDWETIQHESGYPHKIQEMTTVTNKLRRVGRFDLEIVKKAVTANMPTKIALMGVDYLDYANKYKKHYNALTRKTKNLISFLENEFGANIAFIGTGPIDDEIIDLMLEVRAYVEKG